MDVIVPSGIVHLHAVATSVLPRRSLARTVLIACAAGITWSGLGLQLILFLQKAPELRLGLAAGLAKYFTFMTNLTGLAAGCVFTAALWPSRTGVRRWFALPPVQGGVLVYALAVFLVYHFMLAAVWHPAPAWLFAAIILHYVVPAMYLAYWFAFVPCGATRWGHVLYWQLFPIAYAVVIMSIGTSLAGYPYPFLDVELVGWRAALYAMFTVMAGYVLLSIVVVAVDRWRV